MPDLSTNKYLLGQTNRNVIINPYKLAQTSSSLLTGLDNWWDLLGDANDSVGGDNLTTSESFTGTAPNGDSNCILFDGTGGAANTGGNVTSPEKSAITIAGWFKSTNTTGRSIWYFGAENNAQYISNGITYRIGSSTIAYPNTLSINNWYCMVVRADADGWTSYINDVSHGSSSAAFDFTPALGSWDLGALAGVDWIGPMASWAIWNRKLTDSEATEFYNGGVNLKYSDL